MSKSGLVAICAAAAVAWASSAGAEDKEWQFSVSPYAWVPSISGDVGVGGVRAGIDVSESRILETLELGGMLSVEARKNRWGFLADGVYMKISDDAETPGPFFNTIDTTVENGAVDLALAYRVVDRERGWMDLLVGARYLYLSCELDMNPDYEAVDDISSTVMDKVVDTVLGQVEDGLDSKSGQIANELASVKSDLGEAARAEISDQLQIRLDETTERVNQKIDEIMEKIESIPPRQLENIKEKIQEKLESITDAQREALAEAVKEQLENRGEDIKGDAAAIQQEIRSAAEKKIGELKESASAKVQQALAEAEAELSAAIEDAMTAAANADVKEDREWVDPYVGLRGRLNLTERTYVGGRADIGGFGIGSDLTWQIFGGVGFRPTPNVELEAGWRYLAVDYDNDGFVYDVAYSGATVGMTIHL